ncbi:zinc-binding dehydrogenase [Paenibacillus nasutitermitis]|uniref:Alcohol dehydrogenase n=1 Tax=Paenibacillus nasutitermitis TaxID=1652958 RepID=A0A916YYN9_9BACL|nr:zinc-binding dehydrogenase [Paenibacillus nasutitermitis]GGD66871.1 alcohol dehydrogenase [Paenibacillus nasutitermitis]
MKALVWNRPGKPESLEFTELADPVAGPGEIKVKVIASGLNPVDYKVALNGHPAWVYPFVPGVDVAGEVVELGEGVSKWQIGDRVVYHGDLARPGGFAEYSVTTAHTVARIPEGISFVEAAAFPCAGLTAYQALFRKMHIREGQSILIHAGAGGVGGYAIQLAKLAGASIILTTASQKSMEHVKDLGADIGIDYNKEDVYSRVKEITGGSGVDLILNSLNRATAQEDLNVLKFGGQLACIAGAPEIVADFQPSTKSFTLHKLMLGGAHGSGIREAEEELAAMADEFMALMLEKKIKSMMSEIITMEQLPDALTRLSKRHVIGKLVLLL